MSQMGVIRYRLGVRPTSAFPLIATKLRTSLEVGFVPGADVSLPALPSWRQRVE
jgi:hypothetical protein